MADGVSIAQLVIFCPLLLPSFYILIKHSRKGILGWLYLHILIIIKIVAAAITIHDEVSGNSVSEASLILQSVGLSPLLLSTAGILHEARGARDMIVNKKVEWLLVIQYHLLVATAIALVIVGIVNLSEGKATSTTDDLIEAGAAIILLCWVLLVFVSFWSLHSSKRGQLRSQLHVNGSKLLYAVLLTLPFIGLRVIYAVIFLILEINHPSSGFITSTAAKAVLSAVPEMIVAIVLVSAGLVTRNIRHTSSRSNA